jgi:hypothetical protein
MTASTDLDNKLTRVNKLILTPGAHAVLKREGVDTLGHLTKFTDQQLLRMTGMTPENVAQISTELARRGLRLGAEGQAQAQADSYERSLELQHDVREESYRVFTYDEFTLTVHEDGSAVLERAPQRVSLGADQMAALGEIHRRLDESQLIKLLHHWEQGEDIDKLYAQAVRRALAGELKWQ